VQAAIFICLVALLALAFRQQHQTKRLTMKLSELTAVVGGIETDLNAVKTALDNAPAPPPADPDLPVEAEAALGRIGATLGGLKTRLAPPA
jgi:hypothetical protein